MFFTSHKLLKLIMGIFIFFILTYLCFDLIFDLSNNLGIYIEKLPHSWLTGLFIIFVLAIDIIIPVPSSIIMVASGVLFGGFSGGLMCVLGSLVCAVVGFMVSRKMGQDRVKKWLGDEEFERLSRFMKKYGIYVIIFTRAVPLAMESVNCIAGLSKMKLKRFILINIIGFLPLTFLYSYTGEFFGEEKSHNVFIVLALGFFIPIIIWFIIMKLIKIKD